MAKGVDRGVARGAARTRINALKTVLLMALVSIFGDEASNETHIGKRAVFKIVRYSTSSHHPAHL